MQMRKQIILGMFIVLLGCTLSMAQAPTPTPIPQDINGDGIVDWFDLLEVQAEWCFSTRPTMTSTFTPMATMTPEPTPTEPSTERVFSAEPGVGIPDDSPNGVTSTIQVGEDLYVYRLRVGVWITHEWPDDLVVDLEGPDGTSIRLFNEDYYDIHGVFGLDYIPSGPGSLSDFIGKNARGTWKLTVRDLWDEGVGTLDRWDLRILGGQEPPPPPTATPTPGGPSYCIGDYFPLGNGLRWTYTSSYGTALVEMHSPESFCGMSMTRLTMTMGSESQDYYLRLANETLYNYGVPEYAFCSSPVHYGDCTLRHGSRFPQHMEVEGVEFDFSCKWSFVGSQSVPAGTFDDCLQLAVSVEAYDPSSGEAISGTWDVWTVAPGLGRIRVAVLDQFLDVVDMAELTSSSILGKPSSSWSAASAQGSPGSFVIATPEHIFLAILRKMTQTGQRSLAMAQAQAPTPTPIPQDINRDGIVDGEDLLSLKAKWHITNKPTRTPKPPTPTPTQTETPTPTTTPSPTEAPFALIYSDLDENSTINFKNVWCRFRAGYCDLRISFYHPENWQEADIELYFNTEHNPSVGCPDDAWPSLVGMVYHISVEEGDLGSLDLYIGVWDGVPGPVECDYDYDWRPPWIVSVSRVDDETWQFSIPREILGSSTYAEFNGLFEFSHPNNDYFPDPAQGTVVYYPCAQAPCIRAGE